LYYRFFPSADEAWAREFASSIPCGKITMCMLQTHLLLYANDPRGAIDELEDMLESCLPGEECKESWARETLSPR